MIANSPEEMTAAEVLQLTGQLVPWCVSVFHLEFFALLNTNIEGVTIDIKSFVFKKSTKYREMDFKNNMDKAQLIFEEQVNTNRLKR